MKTKPEESKRAQPRRGKIPKMYSCVRCNRCSTCGGGLAEGGSTVSEPGQQLSGFRVETNCHCYNT